nr:hypothetical protein PanWU01x14_065800 [Ipomoea trifida]
MLLPCVTERGNRTAQLRRSAALFKPEASAHVAAKHGDDELLPPLLCFSPPNEKNMEALVHNPHHRSFPLLPFAGGTTSSKTLGFKSKNAFPQQYNVEFAVSTPQNTVSLAANAMKCLPCKFAGRLNPFSPQQTTVPLDRLIAHPLFSPKAIPANSPSGNSPPISPQQSNLPSGETPHA